MRDRKKYETKTKNRVVSALRKIWLYSELRREVLNKYYVETTYFLNPKTGRKNQLKLYLCNACETVTDEIHVDHIKSVGSDDWTERINNMLFCEVDDCQVLCKPCHREKTKTERRKKK